MIKNMKYYIIFIFFFSSFSLYFNQEYSIEYDILLAGEFRYDLNLINNQNNNNNLYYSGKIENIEDIINISEDKETEDTLKDGDHPLVNMLNINYIKYISLFSAKTIFIIEEKDNKYIKKNYINYTFFSINNINYSIYLDFFEREDIYYYVKLGKRLDNTILYILSFLIFFNIFTILFISFIMKRVTNNTDEMNQLPIHYLIIKVSYLLFIVHILNGIIFLFFKNNEYSFLAGHIITFIYSFYKSIFYSTIILVLQGLSTIFYFGYGQKFKKISKKIFLYDLTFTLLNLYSLYFIHFTTKLNLFYIKDLSENCILLCFIIFYIFKIMIPLAKQMKYEQSIRSDLVKTIKFKCKLLLFTIIIMTVYAIFFIISPLIEYKYTYIYIDNFTIHFILQLFYETIFFILLIIVFYPKKLPRNYFDEIVFNYKSLVYLLANIGGKENDNKINDQKLNISNLNYKLLKKLSKKVNYPVVLVNPFTTPKNNSLFNEIHIGTVQRRQK